MKKFILTEEEKNRIKNIYESEGIVLSEDTPVGLIARVARKFFSKSSDEIATAFKTVDAVVVKNIDDIVLNAMKTKNMSEMESLSSRLIHIFNPSGQAQGIEAAKQATINFLNGYAKSKGKANWKIIKDEAMGAKPQVNAAAQQAANTGLQSILQGQRISNRWYGWKPENIDFSKFSNPQTTFDELNKYIATAIKTGQWNYVPRAGFEKFGIKNFREYLQNNIAKVNEVIPETGRWSVNFK
jgi:hypothetical protein